MSPLRRLLPYVWRQRQAFAAGLVCSITTSGIALVSPRLLQIAIDGIAAGASASQLALFGAGLLGVGLVGGVFRYLTRRILMSASRQIEYQMRNDFYAHLQTLPLSYFHAHRTGDLMSRATNDLSAVRMMIGPAVMYGANTALTFVTALIVMWSIDARLTLLGLVPLPFVSVAVKWFGSAIHTRFERLQDQLSTVSAVAQEALAGVRVVRAYGQESTEVARFERANEEYLRRSRALIALQGIFFPSLTALLGLGGMLVLWLGTRDVVAGRMTVGQFVAFFTYFTMLAWPVIAFGWVTNMLQRGMASWRRMVDVMSVVPAIRDEEVAATRPTPIRGAIEFRRLTFGFGDTAVLRDISASLPAGSTTAIVGATGSGKSTLISLLARLHDPPPGTVFVDGIDVRRWPLAELRGAIGLVAQEPFLFSDTLANNVAFGFDARVGSVGSTAVAHHERQSAITRAARLAKLDADIAQFPQGYDTTIGERGITLSGGQKQRTALARALATDPVILMMDDALSAVDTHTEADILEGLVPFMAHRTSIIVAHRVSTVRHADTILVLHDGRIVERGTHEALVDAGGVYASMCRQQQLEDELAAS